MFEWYVLSVTGNAYICLMLRDQGKRKREPRKLIFLFRCEKMNIRLEIPYPHWKVCLGGMLRRYASGFASGVCFGVCFA